jgi:hypothetical protein
LEIEHIESRHSVSTDVSGVSPHFLIASGAKRIRSFSRQNDDTDLRVLMRKVKGLEHLLHRERTEGISHFGPVDGDFSDAVVRLFELDVGEGFDRFPHDVSANAYD